MSAEYVAEILADYIASRQDGDVLDEACEDVRSGGFFFDAYVKGNQYEVLVTQINGGAS